MVFVTSEAKQWGAYTVCGPHLVNNQHFSKMTPKFSVQGFMNSEFVGLSCLDNEVSNNTLYFVCLVQHIKIGT